MVDKVYSTQINPQDFNNQKVEEQPEGIKEASLLSKINAALSATLDQEEQSIDTSKIDILQKNIDLLKAKVNDPGPKGCIGSSKTEALESLEKDLESLEKDLKKLEKQMESKLNNPNILEAKRLVYQNQINQLKIDTRNAMRPLYDLNVKTSNLKTEIPLIKAQDPCLPK